MAPGLKELARERPGLRGELEALEKEAALGRRYLEELRSQVVKLAAAEASGLEMEVIRSIAGKLEEKELTALMGFVSGEGEGRRGTVQLSYGSRREETGEGDGAFLV